jgi:hypothetical protein
MERRFTKAAPRLARVFLSLAIISVSARHARQY